MHERLGVVHLELIRLVLMLIAEIDRSWTMANSGSFVIYLSRVLLIQKSGWSSQTWIRIVSDMSWKGIVPCYWGYVRDHSWWWLCHWRDEGGDGWMLLWRKVAKTTA